ncbi:carbonic anhydrase 2-like [Rhopilema esculentum]|uniref:carbonic anhydrase 2-like n=1 Tax=Rhopilema esculentum TaxID=499914 RepID=UPI0031DFCC47
MLHAVVHLISMSSYLRQVFLRMFSRMERRRRKSLSLGSDWSYSGDLGPENWHKNFPVAAGENQSPINIDTHDVIYDPSLEDLKFSGYHCNGKTVNFRLRNTGYTLKVDLHGDMHMIEDGNCYEATSIVFHWGSADDRGSEHLLDQKAFPMEIQIMHKNIKYSENEDVLYKLDGIKALAVFVEVGEEEHDGLKNIINHLKNVQFAGQESDIPGFSLAFLFPNDTQKYYKYTGSLTSPPCNECVSWTILNNPIKISAGQVRDLLFCCKNLQRY